MGYNRYQKNIMGMWIGNELKKELCPDASFPEIGQAAEESTCQMLVDANAAEFLAPASTRSAFDVATSVSCIMLCYNILKSRLTYKAYTFENFE